MNAFDAPFALLAFLGFVAIVPGWMWFLSSYPPAQNLSIEATFLANLSLPATVLLFIASWLDGGAI